MLTVRHIERLWNENKHGKLRDELMAPRIEAIVAADLAAVNVTTTAAALAMIRLEELNQSHVPLVPKLIRAVIGRQERDGGWGDVMTTALCLRALMLESGRGEAIERGLGYLAALQQAEGIWPKVPLRRMPADAAVSAFVLLQLSGFEKFRQSVRFDEAMEWFEINSIEADPMAQKLWQHARVRGMMATKVRAMEPSLS